MQRLCWRQTAGVVLACALPLSVLTPQRSQAQSPLPEKLIELEEVVVTGSRLRRAEQPPSVVVFDRARIEELGVTAVADVLNYLPQQPYIDGDTHRPGGARFVELRGIGADASIVLINGRRATPSGGAAVGFNAFDLNTLPIAAIERIEVLADAASAVYGADAIGGVINIKLKRSIDAPTLDLYYGAAEGGGEERRLSASAGVAGARGALSAVIDVFDRKQLLGAERDLRGNQDYRRFGGLDWRSMNTYPGNISSLDGDNLPGLSSPIAAVRPGGAGLAPSDFIAGERNRQSLGRYGSIAPEAQRFSAALFGEFGVTESTALFAELMWSDNEIIALTSPASTLGFEVPAENPFNPFGAPVSANYLFKELGPRSTVSDAQSLRGVAGVRGERSEWEWELAAVRSDDEGSEGFYNDVDFARLESALGSSDPASALNVFHDGPAASPAVLASLLAAPEVGRYAFKASQAIGFVRGSPFSWSAGAAQLVVGGEWRRENMVQHAYGVDIDADRTVHAVFGELELPLVSRQRALPGVHALSLTIAGRLDEYDDFGDTFNPQYALNYRPLRDVLLRASYSTSFRAPSLYELYAPRVSIPGETISDPQRNETYEVTRILGGNPQLQPIEASSSTVGLVWTPEALAGLRVGVNYWQIDMEGRVSIFQPQQIVDFEALFPDNVVRGPSDRPGVPGVITEVATSYVNFGELRTSGIDLNVTHVFETAAGAFVPTLAATWIDEFEIESLPGIPIVDRVGVAQTITGTITQWRASAGLSWSRSGWSAALNARHTPSYDDAMVGGLVRNGRTIEAQTIVDAQASYQFAHRTFGRVLDGLQLSLGLLNMFDELPHFAEAGGPFGYDPYQGDPRGRFGYIRLSAQF